MHQLYDRIRQTELEQLGYHVYRITNDSVINNIDATIQRLQTYIATIPPLPKGEGRVRETKI